MSVLLKSTAASNQCGSIFAAQTGISSRYVKDCHHYKPNVFYSNEQKHTPENLKHTSPTSAVNIGRPWGTFHRCPAGIQWHQAGGKKKEKSLCLISYTHSYFVTMPCLSPANRAPPISFSRWRLQGPEAQFG